MVELEDQGYTAYVKCSQYKSVITISKIPNFHWHQHFYQTASGQRLIGVSILDLGEEFMGRLFGMLKDRHNDTGMVVIDNETTVNSGHKFEVKNYDNLDFIFDESNINNIIHHSAQYLKIILLVG